MNSIEFFVSPDGEILYRKVDDSVKVASEDSRELIEMVLTKIREHYPDAFARLSENYSRSEKNRHYFEFLMFRRFIKCNCSKFDEQKYDIDERGKFNFEQVHCPLRGECRDEGVICKPKLKTELSAQETRVLAFVAQGMSNEDIASELHISANTVHNHRNNILTRLSVRNVAEAVAWYVKNMEK